MSDELMRPSHSVMLETATRELKKLIPKMFSTGEFRRWLKSKQDFDIDAHLPGWVGSDAAFDEKAIALLIRGNRIDSSFFFRLGEAHRAHWDEVSRVSAIWSKFSYRVPGISPPENVVHKSDVGLLLRKALAEIETESGSMIADPADASQFTVSSYPPRFGVRGAEEFLACGIPPAATAGFPEDFSAWMVIRTIRAGGTAGDVWKYPLNIESSDIVRLIQAGVSADALASESDGMNPGLFAELVSLGATTQDLHGYPARFSHYERICLMREGISAESAGAYVGHISSDSYISSYELIKLVRAGVTPLMLSSKPDKVTLIDFAKIVSSSALASDHEKYPARFSTAEKIDLIKAGVSSELAKEYCDRFSGATIITLYEKGRTPEETRGYAPIFGGAGINLLIQWGVPCEHANRYPLDRWAAWGVVTLYYGDFAWSIGIEPIPDRVNAPTSPVISPEVASKYYREFLDGHIVFLFHMGVRPDTFSLDQQRSLYRLLSQPGLLDFLNDDRDRFQLLGAGNHAVVMMDNHKRRAVKFSRSLGEEIRLLRILKEKHSRTSHVCNLVAELVRDAIDVIEIEYVPGKTLGHLLDREKRVMSLAQGLKYGRSLLLGLLELKACGIFHRDLWLGNVMIDESRDVCVIIDLGIATDEIGAPPLNNRRYGGTNDLQSLAQILFRMVAGHHIFKPSINTLTYLVPDEIRAERERHYGDPGLFRRRVGDVYETIHDLLYSSIIITCLKARGADEDYETVLRMFDEPLTSVDCS